jgi:hypothetical protein
MEALAEAGELGRAEGHVAEGCGCSMPDGIALASAWPGIALAAAL